MDLTSFVLVVKQPIFELGAKPGDRIVVEPGHPDPVTIVRSLRPVYGELAGALADDRVESPTLSPDLALTALLDLARSTPPAGPSSGRRRRRAARWQRAG